MAERITNCISAGIDWIETKSKKFPPAIRLFVAIFPLLYVTFSLIGFPYGIYYLVKGTAISYETSGTLISAESYVSSGSGSSAYYAVKEVFAIQHGGVSSTCTLEQPTQYAFQGSADSEANSKKLGTVRDVFVMSYSSGVCIDENLKQLYTNVGLGLTIPSIPVWLVIFAVFFSLLFEACCCDGENDEGEKRSYSLPTSVNL